jgi:hypothetical protein
MRLHEIESIKPNSPAEQRLQSLRAIADKAQSAVKQELQRQRIAKAQAALRKAQKRISDA